MQVFKGAMLILKRNLPSAAIYFLIFVGLTLLMQRFFSAEVTEQFEASRVRMAVIDRGEDELGAGIRTFLYEKHELVDIPDDMGALQEALFNRTITYVVIIPEDASQHVLVNNQPIETVKIPGTASGLFVDNQLNTFLNSVRIFHMSGYSLGEAIDITLEQGEEQVGAELLDRDGRGGVMGGHVFLFQFLPYLFISVCGFALGCIVVLFSEKEVKRRIFCSSISVWQRNFGILGAFLVFGIVMWVISNLLVLVAGREFFADPNRWYFLINSSLLMLVSLALAFLIGVAVKNDDGVRGASQMAGLVLCFLSGVFVPMEVMGAGVRSFAQFLPTYWYVENVLTLGRHVNLTDAMRRDIYTGFGIQLIFAVAFVCIALAIVRVKHQEK